MMEQYYIDEVVGGRSLCFYACFLMFGLGAKCFTQRCLHPGFQCLAFDLTAAFVVYGCTFCHGYIANVFGPPGHLIALIAVGILQRIVLCGSANPLPHIIKLVECPTACDKDAALWRIGTIMVGGVIAHPFAKMLWIGLMPDVDPHSLENMHCLMPTPTARAPIFVPLAAGVEFLGCVIICAMYTGSICCGSTDAYELCTKFFLGCFFNCLDSAYTAIHLNPMLAGSMLFGCACDDVIKALSVYWLAPVLAAIGFACGCCCPWPSPCFSLPCCPTSTCPRSHPGPCPPECASPAPCPPAPSCQMPCPKPCPKPTPKPCPQPCQPSSSLPCPKPCPPKPCPPPSSQSCQPAACPLPCPPTANRSNNCPPNSCPRPCDPQGQITAQMRQLNKDGQKQVNYVICIPPMCTEKGVRLQHKFVVDKEDEDGGGGKGDSRRSEGSIDRDDRGSVAKDRPSRYSRDSRTSSVRPSTSNNNANVSNKNSSNRRGFVARPTGSVVPSDSGTIDIRLNGNGARLNNDGWMSLTPTVKRRSSKTRPTVGFHSDTSD